MAGAVQLLLLVLFYMLALTSGALGKLIDLTTLDMS